MLKNTQGKMPVRIPKGLEIIFVAASKAFGWSETGFSPRGLLPAWAKPHRLNRRGKNAPFCHSERSEESLLDLSVRKETRRDSSLRSE
jgi:hypothetical protein